MKLIFMALAFLIGSTAHAAFECNFHQVDMDMKPIYVDQIFSTRSVTGTRFPEVEVVVLQDADERLTVAIVGTGAPKNLIYMSVNGYKVLNVDLLLDPANWRRQALVHCEAK